MNQQSDVQVCSGCKFWSSSLTVDDDFRIGECRKNPPKLMTRMLEKQSRMSEAEEAAWLSTSFPVTTEDSWCGKWKAKVS